MNILTNGDSFTYGQELSDIKLAWPHILAHKINASVVNIGAPGSSNDSILRRTLDYLVSPQHTRPDLVIIGWSSAGRSEMADDIGVWDVWPGTQQTLDGVPWRSKLIEYVSNYHDAKYYNKKYYQQVILLQTFLKTLGIKSVMLNTQYYDYYRRLFFNEQHWYRPMIDTAQFIEFDCGGMIEWTEHCARGPGGHFLEEGHQIVANKVYEHIRNLGWVS